MGEFLVPEKRVASWGKVGGLPTSNLIVQYRWMSTLLRESVGLPRVALKAFQSVSGSKKILLL